MAGIKKGITKGLASINIKTANFMETNKLKTHISTLEDEINKMTLNVGEIIYQSWAKKENGLEECVPILETIKLKRDTVIKLQSEIKALEDKEKEILGNLQEDKTLPKSHSTCSNCGSALLDNAKFCTKCGTPVVR